MNTAGVVICCFILAFCVWATGYAMFTLWKQTTWAEHRKLIRQFRSEVRARLDEQIEAWK